jgi:hypothetical protein
MKRRRRRIAEVQVRSTSSRVMALSLFIMLLAFFIVLNALSTYEEAKVKPIFESLEAAFASRVDAEGDLRPSVTKSKEHSINEGNTVDRLHALFRSRIPAKDIVKSQHRGTMQVIMGIDEFELIVMSLSEGRKFGEKQESGAGGLFLPTLVALLRSDQLKTPYHMDIVLNLNNKPAYMQNSEPKKLGLSMKRMSSFSKRIEEAGLPSKLITIGMQEGKEDTIELLFKPHIPFSPVNSDYEVGTTNE